MGTTVGGRVGKGSDVVVGLASGVDIAVGTTIDGCSRVQATSGVREIKNTQRILFVILHRLCLSFLQHSSSQIDIGKLTCEPFLCNNCFCLEPSCPGIALYLEFR